MKLLLFDVDQTLISTGGAGIRALNRAFMKVLSIENAMDGVLPHGKTDPGIIREIFDSRRAFIPTGSADRVLEAYLAFLPDEVQASPSYRVLPGVHHILEELHGRDSVLLGLATGNVELGARIKLERGNLNRYFAFGGFGSDSGDRTVLVRRAVEAAEQLFGRTASPGDVFVIGDTPNDVRAGSEAGFATIGVATGAYTTAQLQASGATAVISDFEQDRERFLQITGVIRG